MLYGVSPLAAPGAARAVASRVARRPVARHDAAAVAAPRGTRSRRRRASSRRWSWCPRSSPSVTWPPARPSATAGVGSASAPPGSASSPPATATATRGTPATARRCWSPAAGRRWPAGSRWTSSRWTSTGLERRRGRRPGRAVGQGAAGARGRRLVRHDRLRAVHRRHCAGSAGVPRRSRGPTRPQPERRRVIVSAPQTQSEATMRKSLLLICLLLGALLPGVTLATADTDPQPDAWWPQWRGPLGTGAAPTADPPIRWSEERERALEGRHPGPRARLAGGLGRPYLPADGGAGGRRRRGGSGGVPPGAAAGGRCASSSWPSTAPPARPSGSAPRARRSRTRAPTATAPGPRPRR